MRGLCANAVEGYRAFSTPWGGPHTRRSSRRRRFSFGSQITFNGLRSALYALHFLRKVIIISRLHLSALWAGFVCQLQTSLKEFFLAFRDILTILSKQEGLKLKSWWRSDARQCLCESVSHLLRQCTRASVGIVSAVERIGNNAIRSRLGGNRRTNTVLHLLWYFPLLHCIWLCKAQGFALLHCILNGF